MTAPKRTAFQLWGRRAAIALGVLLVLAVAGEVVLRLTSGLDPELILRMQLDANTDQYARDPELGALAAPSQDRVIETPDYTYTFRTDHAGFPNPEPWPDQIDVAVLGNSLLDGPGVGMEGQFTTLLAQRLGDRTVLNLALPGGGTEHQYLVYRRYVRPLQPKLVIAVLWTMWDVTNSWQFDRWRHEKSDPDYTHYRMTYGDTHNSGPPATPSLLKRTWSAVKRQLANSYLLKSAYQGALSLSGKGIPEQVSFANGDTVYLSARYQQRLAEGMDRPDEPNIREIFFQPLEHLQADVEAQGGRFLVVLVPNKEELYGADALPANLRTVEEVREGMDARGLPVLDLYPVLAESAREQPAFYPADMHLNAFGNRIIADAIERWIADQRIFPPPAPALAGTGSD